MGERHSEHTRDPDDFYVEPASCIQPLLARYRGTLLDGLHDPCAGRGTIPQTASRVGIPVTGADLVDRANGKFHVQDFLSDRQARRNIVTNPPFKIAAQIVEHALKVVQPMGIVAVIAQAKFLFSQSRHPLFNRPEMERVLVMSRRPSMPPGKMLEEQGEACRGGGSLDFVWCVWRVGGSANRMCAAEWVL